MSHFVPPTRRDFLKTSLVLAGAAALPRRLAADGLVPATAPAELPANALPSGIKFVTHRLGHFRSEACCVADFNGDGKLDILAGEFLYLAPDWKPVKIRTIKGRVDDHGDGYRWDFANLALDVDGDGLPDLISVDWFEKRSVWLRNIGTGGQEWPLSVIDTNGPYETAQLLDVQGIGKPTNLVSDTAETAWYEVVKDAAGKPSFVKHLVTKKPQPFGLGVGDILGKGKPAIIRPGAWFEAPDDIRTGQWIEHPIALGGKNEGQADHTAQILVYDVDGDGLNDLICSSAHQFGIFWYQQIRANGQIRFQRHLIDDTWTQCHSLALGDIDGDGIPELVVGKRFRAHNGHDPQEDAPLGVYYYKLHQKPTPTWTKHVISYGEGIGAGLNICLVDLTGSGRLDVITTGKWGGPVWFENKGPA